MRTIIKQAEEELLKALDAAYQSSDPWFAVHFACSKLNIEHCQPKHLQIAVNIIGEELSNEASVLYYCFDKDIILLCKRISVTQLHKLVEKVKFLFVDDPLITSSDSAFAELYDLRNNYDKLYLMCKQKQSYAKEHYKKLGDDISPESNIRNNVDTAEVNISLLKHSINDRKTRTKLKILVVEDHDFSRKLVIKALGRDFDSITADNGAQAIES